MAKFEEAQNRLYKRVYVCKTCKTKIKADPMSVIAKKVKCRRCNAKKMRAVRKK